MSVPFSIVVIGARLIACFENEFWDSAQRPDLGNDFPFAEVMENDRLFPWLPIPQRDLLYKHDESVEDNEVDVKNDLSNTLELAEDPPMTRGAPMIAFSSGHDASIAVSLGGRVQCVLELERFFGVRHFPWPNASSWQRALNVVQERCEIELGEFPKVFKYGLVESRFFKTEERTAQGEQPLYFKEFRELIEAEVTIENWRFVDHHLAHALIGYYASPFRSALVVSYDGGGNDGVFNIYFAAGTRVKRVGKVNMNMGSVYMFVAMMLPEVSKIVLNKEVCSNPLREALNITENKFMLSASGKLMGYAATGQGKELTEKDIEFSSSLGTLSRMFIENFAENYEKGIGALGALIEVACRGQETQRLIAAAFQYQWEEVTIEQLTKWVISAITIMRQKIEGVVLSGGCALNVLVNQRFHDSIQAIYPPWGPLDLYVPPAQGDEGIVVGALYAAQPPLARQPLQYMGFRLFDEETLNEIAVARGAQDLSTLGGVDYLAELLVGTRPCLESNCTKEKPIIAIVRGRAEYGPRALGHRSLIAVPDSEWMRDRLNRLKVREWYRPVCPMIAEEALEEVFGYEVKSPYMTMAPPVNESIKSRFPAMVHLDGTARHQSVGKKDEPWLHALLHAVGRRTGCPCLINTSFNSKGKPITNTVEESLTLLENLEDLDYLLIEDWLFSKPKSQKP
eukprot:gnl/MRDRNA2_/MRDRNA2_31557_c0_seq1.p1 gnl/MRDRNA2_/MRDRNA2_31557_c0~~gnl/MRDRNA2_/MRDRNA2_31557_c0_seq1.p1  ORF type:complete len:681 (-),score=100.96 gnl/MRDRNA2_/MRDRNA2_31557_c0_seq1:265-2307(-)